MSDAHLARGVIIRPRLTLPHYAPALGRPVPPELIVAPAEGCAGVVLDCDQPVAVAAGARMGIGLEAGHPDRMSAAGLRG